MTDPFWCPTWYFAMYPRRWSDPETWFLHCDLWGVTRDETWVFLNPSRHGFEVSVAHKADEVDALWAVRMAVASRIYRYEGERIARCTMPIAPLTCASVCAHILGFRAWTPTSLERKLVANGATVIWQAGEGDGGLGNEQQAQGDGRPHQGLGV